MPIGVIINSASTLLGGVLGCLLNSVIPKRFQEDLPVLFGYCAMAIGINSIIKVQSMAAVVIAVVLGYCLGSALLLERRGQRFLKRVIERVFARTLTGQESRRDDAMLITVAALFCFSGFGWYGALMESLTGSAEILISKSVLDFFTAMLFAVLLGKVICILLFMQLAVLLLVFLTGRLLGGFFTPDALANLSAAGGILTLATGFRVARIKSVPIFDMVPALVLVFPLTLLLVG